MHAARHGRYAPLSREAPAGAWQHALHGDVPGRAADFICCPDGARGELTRAHVAQLARLMKNLEPRTGSPFVFAIVNLSRDASPREPGGGALALVLGARMSGEKDGAGRVEPPFAHAIAAAGRRFTAEALWDASLAFFSRAIGPRETEAEAPRGARAFHRAFARCVSQAPAEVSALVERYLGRFADVPAPPPGAVDEAWIVDAERATGRIVIVHEEEESFASLAEVASRLAATLLRSSARWTAVVCGGSVKIAGGLTLELVPRRPAYVGRRDRILRLEELPDSEEVLAREILGARPAIELTGPPTPRAPQAADDDPTRVCSKAELDEALARSAAAEREPAVTLKVDNPVQAELAREETPLDMVELAREEPEADAVVEVDVDVEALSERAPDSEPPDFLPPWRSRRWVRWLGILGLGAVLTGILVGLIARGEALLSVSATAPAPAPAPVAAPVAAPAPVSDGDSAPASFSAPDSVAAPGSDRESAPEPAMTRSP